MKVRCVITVEVDPEAWELTYGSPDGVSLRQDVRDYITAHVQGSAAADEGCITNVTLQRGHST